jgi:hypothetical protein
MNTESGFLLSVCFPFIREIRHTILQMPLGDGRIEASYTNRDLTNATAQYDTEGKINLKIIK